jgi:hypothetical protein
MVCGVGMELRGCRRDGLPALHRERLIAVSLPLILSRVGRAHNATDGDATKGDDKPVPFLDWARGDFDTWQGRLTGTQAAMQIVLPIAAAALGMTAIGIAFHVVEHGGV